MKPALKELQVRVSDLQNKRHKNMSIPLSNEEYDMICRIEERSRSVNNKEVHDLALRMIDELQRQANVPLEERVDVDDPSKYFLAINIVRCERCLEKGRCVCNNKITGAPECESNLYDMDEENERRR